MIKIETNIITLQQRLREIGLIGNRRQSIIGSERVRHKQAVILRNRAIPTRTVNTHIKHSVIGYINLRVAIKVYQRRSRGQIGIVCIGDRSISVLTSDVVGEEVAEEFTVDAFTGERDADPDERWETVFVCYLRIVAEDGVEIC